MYFHYSGTFNVLTAPRVGNHVDPLELPSPAGESVQLSNLTGKQPGGLFPKMRNTLMQKELKWMSTQRLVDMIHNSFIHNSQELRTTQMR